MQRDGRKRVVGVLVRKEVFEGRGVYMCVEGENRVALRGEG
jgi:hypothetical protein